MEEPRWLDRRDVERIHAMQIEIHGGRPGIRDLGLLESAIERPRQLFHYAAEDIAGLAAALAYGLGKNHAFVDGNKRTALVATELFLALNRHGLVLKEAARYYVWYGVAAGVVSEADLREIFRKPDSSLVAAITAAVRRELAGQGAEDPFAGHDAGTTGEI